MKAQTRKTPLWARAAVFPASFVLRLLGFLLPKKHDLWLFGAWSGQRYADNSRALFEYANEQSASGVRPVWITKSVKIRDQLVAEGREAHLYYSWEGFRVALIAGVLVVCDSWLDLPWTAFLFNRRCRLVQLWHGTSLKKVDLKTGSLPKRVLRYLFLAHLGREYDIVFTASAKNIGVFSDRFNIPRDRIIVTGQPRNDRLFRGRRQAFLEGLVDTRKVLYVPTWRPWAWNPFRGSGFDLGRLESCLKKHDAVLLMAKHPHLDITGDDLQASDRIIMIPGAACFDDVLREADVMLTDYSSAFFDFLLLDRPIIFTAFDLEDYADQNGFNYEYGSVTPGPKVRDWPEVLVKLDDILAGHDRHAEERRLMRVRFNEFSDGESSRRVYEHLRMKSPGL